MKKNLVAILLGTLSLAALVPLTSVFAQSPSPTPTGPGYSSLTPAQQEQIKQLRESAKRQVEAVLTADQRSQYQAAITQGKKPKEAMQSLNLSPEQQTQIRQIRESTHQQVNAIAPGLTGKKNYSNLTDSQKAQLKALKNAAKQQIDAVLTSDQRSQYQAAIAQGKKPKEAMQGLNLTPEQQTQIQQIRENTHQQINAIAPGLTGKNR
jgi:periplasmic protein CpxP/Spy